MKKKVKATVCNKWKYYDTERDFQDIINAIQEAKDLGSELIVFPEEILNSFKSKKDQESKIALLSQTANQLDIIVCCGITETDYEQDPNGSIVYNSAFLFEDNKIMKYRKVHLVWHEPEIQQPGDLGFPVFDTKLGKIGILICYDDELPESMRTLKLNGAEIICKVSAWPSSDGMMLDIWKMYLTIRARENQVFLLASNVCGSHTYQNDVYEDDENNEFTVEFCGHSAISNPFGKVLAMETQDIEPYSLITAVLDGDDVINVKNHVGPNTDPIASRRPECYGPITKK